MGTPANSIQNGYLGTTHLAMICTVHVPIFFPYLPMKMLPALSSRCSHDSGSSTLMMRCSGAYALLMRAASSRSRTYTATTHVHILVVLVQPSLMQLALPRQHTFDVCLSCSV